MNRLFLTLCIMMLTATKTAWANDYCLSIRGNGELAPAHWGAMASVVEKLGLPRAQAGGSSASISIFLLDSIASSDYVKADPPSAAFLLKSLEGITFWVQKQKEWQDFALLAQQGQSLATSKNLTKELSDIFTDINQVEISDALQKLTQSLPRIKKSIEVLKQLHLVNLESLAQINQAILIAQTNSDPQQLHLAFRTAQFYSSEMYKSYEVFGKFNAETDANLFFRAGLVNFDGLALQLGRIGGFLQSASPQKFLWQSLYQTCAADLQNKTWSELVNRKPTCQDLLSDVLEDFFRTDNRDFSKQPIGQAIVSFPITAVLTESAYTDAKTSSLQYSQDLDAEFGKNFKLSNYDDVRFGYWGAEKNLKKIATHLDPKDAKSQRFLALNQAPWYEALRLSPAEPGLSPFREFTSGSQSYYSAGGWPDLTPTLVLKAYGCKNIVHITRRGGESLFAQGVAKRLLNLDRSWDLLSTSPEAYDANWTLNNLGDFSDTSSKWSALYNLANEKSSYKKSLSTADAILCTDWNKFAITDGPTVLIEHGYRSPYYVKPTGGLQSLQKLVTQTNPLELNPAGYPEYVGCQP